MATGKSKTEAIKEMKELFKKMDIDTINSRIDEITSYYGVSPYLKQAQINGGIQNGNYR